MEKIKKLNLINILGKCIVSFALIVTTAYIFIAHQSKCPNLLKNFRGSNVYKAGG
jgi:hypothetical protein